MNSLIQEVNDAVYRNIEDVVAFVKWLDDELCFLVSFQYSKTHTSNLQKYLTFNFVEFRWTRERF